MSVRQFRSDPFAINVNSFPSILIGVMFVVVVFDMGGQVGIRNIVMPICIVMLAIIRRIAIPRQFILLYMLLIVYPTFLLMVGVMKGADLSVAVSQYRSTILALILMIILSNTSYNFIAKALYSSIAITALVAIILAVSLMVGTDIFAGLISRMHEDRAGYFGLRAVGESLLPNIYFKSTLFYVPAALFFYRMAVIFYI